MSAGTPNRLTSIDALRGVVIVLMALDHVRDYFHPGADPTDLATTTMPLFLTRWITHFCAPVFMLLAGTSAYLMRARGMSRGELSRFLVTRGLWLIVLEVTVIRCLGWTWNVEYSQVWLLVIWALGASMIVLAALIWIPHGWLVVLCVVGIAGHNAFDTFEPHGEWGWLWTLLHEPGILIEHDAGFVGVFYVLVPWVFVMGLGYAVGPVMSWEAPRRRRALVVAGVSMLAAFLVLRITAIYGDSNPWRSHDSLALTVIDVLDCTKYPPSLLYLLMTLGPAALALAWLEERRGWLHDVLVTFGRVPLLFYVLHLPLIHGGAVVLTLAEGHDPGFLFANVLGPPGGGGPPDHGVSLPTTYAVWIAALLVLYLPCRWFARVKRERRSPWLSYL